MDRRLRHFKRPGWGYRGNRSRSRLCRTVSSGTCCSSASF
ncbi:hypothetical protein HTIA_0472 [Halorhabdus tiamatea SARL4B]|uniref:Uncharacterized protein n=1 Tax=Halorhabdus tiamatea SARL4B TaxID=1033806 RepID=S6CT36_9EURY|nr:hypothetical protein HTIA_0472 [Halorhabdus tiamatea SARL4B]